MAPTSDARRATRPPLESVREAPFALVRDTTDGEPNDGLTLDGYGAVFNSITVINSHEGRFREQNAPGSMKRSFRETPPKIQFDHGRHPMIGSIPIAALRSISEDVDPVLAPDGGAHVVARLFDNWLMQPVRDAIAAQAIDGMSYRFEVVREMWAYGDGSPIRDERALQTELDRCLYNDVPDEELPLRTLKELKIREIGPVTWPAYEATSVGMRSKVIDLGRLNDPAQRKLLAEAVFIADRAESGAETVRQTDSDDDPAMLASALDAVLDEAAELIAGVDMTTLPPEVAQACALITAAETAADALLEAMGIYDPDDDESSEPAGRSKADVISTFITAGYEPGSVIRAIKANDLNLMKHTSSAPAGRSKDVDTQQPTTTVGERQSHDAQQDTAPVVERPSPPAAFRRFDAQRSTFVGERPSQPRRLSDKNLRLRNQRDLLLTFRSIGDRSQ